MQQNEDEDISKNYLKKIIKNSEMSTENGRKPDSV